MATPTNVATIRQVSHDERQITIDASGSEKYESVRMKYRIFGGASISSGGARQLGERAGDPGRADALRADTYARPAHQPRPYGHTEPRQRLFPSLVEGEVSQIDAKKATVAVVVNGTIAAVARTSTTGGATRFYAMLPPRLFAAPTDVVEVFLLERDPLGRPLLLGARAGPSQNSERQPNTRCAGA